MVDLKPLMELAWNDSLDFLTNSIARQLKSTKKSPNGLPFYSETLGQAELQSTDRRPQEPSLVHYDANHDDETVERRTQKQCVIVQQSLMNR